MEVANSCWASILQKLLLKFWKITFLESPPVKALEAASLDLINFVKVKRDLVVQHVSDGHVGRTYSNACMELIYDDCNLRCAPKMLSSYGMNSTTSRRPDVVTSSGKTSKLLLIIAIYISPTRKFSVATLNVLPRNRFQTFLLI